MQIVTECLLSRAVHTLSIQTITHECGLEDVDRVGYKSKNQISQQELYKAHGFCRDRSSRGCARC